MVLYDTNVRVCVSVAVCVNDILFYLYWKLMTFFFLGVKYRMNLVHSIAILYQTRGLKNMV